MGRITDMSGEVLIDVSRAGISRKWREDCRPANETAEG